MEALRDFLFWLDAAPVRYWSLAWTCGAAVVLLAVWPRRWPAGKLATGWAFALAVVLMLFAFRWPAFFYRADLNPDEAQIVAGAITLHEDPVVWRSLDTTTHGPLLEYPLIVTHAFGAPFNYVTARVIGVLLQALALVATWRTLRRFAPEPIARIGILPGLFFWSLIAWEDYLHYSSELPGITLLALSTWAAAALFSPATGRGPGTTTAFFAGLAAGLVPLAKLQSVPQAAGLLLITAGLIWFAPICRPQRQRLLGALCAGVAVVGIGLGVYLQAFSLWREFWLTYITSALAYMETSAYPFAAMPGRFFHFAATAPVFAMFFWGALGFAVLYLREPVQDRSLRVARRVAWALLALAMFTVLRPGREAAHYLHLLVVPLTLLAGLTLAGACPTAGRYRVMGAFVVLALAPQVWDRLATGSRFIGNAAHHWQEPASPVAEFIGQHLHPGDTMAMWGWAPHLHVELQLPHVTREPHSGNQIMQWSLTRFFVERYLQDITRCPPIWFVDVVGPGAFIYDSRATQAHESVPALRDLISRDYDLVAEIDGSRIYLHKGRLPRP